MDYLFRICGIYRDGEFMIMLGLHMLLSNFISFFFWGFKDLLRIRSITKGFVIVFNSLMILRGSKLLKGIFNFVEFLNIDNSLDIIIVLDKFVNLFW